MLPPSRAASALTRARNDSNHASSMSSPRRGPPISTAVRGCGNCASMGKRASPAASQSSSTGLSAPMVWTTFAPASASWRGATTRSKCLGSMRGSRICTVKVLPPLAVRNQRVSVAPSRPHAMASAGQGACRHRRKSASTPIRRPAVRRGANHAQGPRRPVRRVRASICMACANARAWRSLPAAPSVRIQQAGFGVSGAGTAEQRAGFAASCRANAVYGKSNDLRVTLRGTRFIARRRSPCCYAACC